MSEAAGGVAPQQIDWDTATPEQAFAEAQRRIADAKASGASKLSLELPNSLKTLKALPPEIGALSDLRELHLTDMDVDDLSPLAGLTGLEQLNICRLPVTDLSPLASLKNLNYAFLTQLPASDLGPLSKLPALEVLNFHYGIPVTDLTPLASIQSLRRISFEDCREITDFSPLAKLPELTMLLCANTKISDLAPLSSMSKLQTLDLCNTPVADLTPLAGLTELTELKLWQTQVCDLRPLARLHKLTLLWLGGCSLVSDIKPLARLTLLRTLYLDHTAVTDLGPVAEFTRMMDQWTDKSDPNYDDPDDDDYAYDDPHEEDRRGLHYDGTPVAVREPYCWLVRLHSLRRTVETINVVRRGKQLPPYYPEGYEPPEAAEGEGSGSESKDIIDRVRDHMEQLEKAVRAREKGEGWWQTIRKGVLFGLGSLLATGAAYGVCLIVKAYETTVRGWIDQLGGSQTLHWIVDMMVKVVPSIG